MQQGKSYHTVDIEILIEQFKSDPNNGLTSVDVSSYQKIYGPNKLEEEEKEHIVLRYIDQFKDPLILLLLGSAALSVLVGQYEDAISIAVAVIIVGTVAFVQELKSEETLAALNTLVPNRCNVVRNGQTINTSADELVPGDVIKLHTGDRVPADARIIKSIGLYTDESTLTGESEPREKHSITMSNMTSEVSISERTNVVYLGTLVTSGSATCMVVSTNISTEFGKVFQEMKEIESKKTPLQVKMDELGKKLSIFSFGIIACIVLVGVIQGKSLLVMFNIGVSLAVAAIPEGNRNIYKQNYVIILVV